VKKFEKNVRQVFSRALRLKLFFNRIPLAAQWRRKERKYYYSTQNELALPLHELCKEEKKALRAGSMS
jgi:hypothetical protein